MVMNTKAVVLIISLTLAGGRCHVAGAAPPTASDLVGRFSLTNFQDVLSNRLYTQEGMNRGNAWGDQYIPARNAIYAQFQSLGYSPALDPFSYLRGVEGWVDGCNIVAVKPGLRNPSNEIYVVSGHYDSAGTPGADDDASGVACVLEMARIFHDGQFAKTIVFIAFDAEECIDDYGITQPGSAHYARVHANENIQRMISIDMIAHQASGVYSNTAYLEGPDGTEPIRNELKTALETFGDGLLSFQPTEPGASDHIAFAREGFQACSFTEAEWANNPNFHKPTDYADYPGNLDWNYASRMARVMIGYFATRLQIVDVTPATVGIALSPHGPATIQFSGLPGCRYATEVTTNLAAPVWSAVETNTAATVDGSFITLDSIAGSRPASFYRARFVPAN